MDENKKTEAILIEADDWEGLFIDGVLIEEGHTLNEGYSRIKYFVILSKKYNFDLEKLNELYIEEVDKDELYDCGGFPNTLEELKGNYK